VTTRFKLSGQAAITDQHGFAGPLDFTSQTHTATVGWVAWWSAKTTGLGGARASVG
jgi:hypothetical protein